MIELYEFKQFDRMTFTINLLSQGVFYLAALLYGFSLLVLLTEIAYHDFSKKIKASKNQKMYPKGTKSFSNDAENPPKEKYPPHLHHTSKEIFDGVAEKTF